MFQLHYSCCCDLDDDHDGGDDDHDDDDYTACKKITYDIMSLELLYKLTKSRLKKTRVKSQDKRERTRQKQIRK